MRLLIAKLASASVQTVSVALNSETDLADLATDLESCVELLRGGRYDLVLMILSQSRLPAREAIARLRREAGNVPMVVLTEPGGHEAAAVGGAQSAQTRGPPAVSASGQALAHETSGLQASEQDDFGNPALVGRRIAGQIAGNQGPAPGARSATALADIVDASGDTGIAAPWMWDEPPLTSAAEPVRPRGHRQRGGLRRIALDTQNEMLRVDDRTVGLSQAEFRIFARLWESRGRIVSAEDLMEAIYGQGSRPASRVLPVFLFKLRRKLTPLGLGDLVETAIGRGFTIRGDAEIEAHA